LLDGDHSVDQCDALRKTRIADALERGFGEMLTREAAHLLRKLPLLGGEVEIHGRLIYLSFRRYSIFLPLTIWSAHRPLTTHSIIFVHTCVNAFSPPRVRHALILRNQNMKSFLIKYRFQNGSEETWHRDIAEFISALDNDATLQGKISYRCMKSRDGADYYHLAIAVDDEAVKSLQSRAFFTSYTEKTKRAGGESVEVLPLELIAETKRKA
jgi:hypothetical protein